MTNTTVTIQDMVVAAIGERLHDGTISFNQPTGEFGRIDQFYKLIVPSPEDSIERISKHINGLMTKAGDFHRASYCDANGQLKAENVDKVTRLITNEFYFYTAKPFSLSEFERLQQQIVDMAKSQPENLHLVFASFAVQSSDDTVMNVTAHIECGSQPKIHFIVKNYVSIFDPGFNATNANGEIKHLKPVHIKEKIDSQKVNPDKEFVKVAELEPDELASSAGVSIDGKNIPFSFNNVITCHTAGGTGFYSCIDICRDHTFGVAKNNLDALMTKRMNNDNQSSVTTPEPLLFSHILPANGMEASLSNSLGTVTTADPIFSYKESKQGATLKYKEDIGAEVFGTPSCMLVTEPIACDHLLRLAIDKNNLPMAAYLMQQGIDVNVPIKSSGLELLTPSAIAAQKGNLDMINLINQSNMSKEDSFIINPLQQAANSSTAQMIRHLGSIESPLPSVEQERSNKEDHSKLVHENNQSDAILTQSQPTSSSLNSADVSSHDTHIPKQPSK